MNLRIFLVLDDLDEKEVLHGYLESLIKLWVYKSQRARKNSKHFEILHFVLETQLGNWQGLGGCIA